VSKLPNHDLLCKILIGMLDHLQKWIVNFIQIHEQLEKYNAISLSVAAYHNLTPTNKS
jgi:hypothetical protein